MRYKLIFILIILTLIIIPSTFSDNKEIETQVLEALEESEEISVIIELEKDPEDLNFIEKFQAADLEMEELADNYFVTEINEEELDELLSDPNVISIEEDEIASLFLDGTIPIINADDTWIKQKTSINITGNGETVCVIDTGINASHPALANRVLAEKCFCDVTNLGSGGCCPDNTNEDTSAKDDHSHGTHVAGIVASNDTTYTGVAPAVNIVAVKVTNSSGAALFSDIEQGINYCRTNAETYNISVITLSLGGGTYSADCDASYSSLTTEVDTATANNITVVAATGNAGSTTTISSPACIDNVIAVSSSDANAVPSYADRNSITDILAPGGDTVNYIKSTDYDGSGTRSKYGTSMATPHVAAAIALLQQYKTNFEGRNLTVSEIKNTITGNGTTISDSGTGIDFIRLDVLLSIQQIDELIPNMKNPNTTEQTHYDYNNISFRVNATDLNLNSVWLEGNWSGSYTNNSMTNSYGDLYMLNITNSSFSAGDTFQWRISSNDSRNNMNTTDWFNITILTGAPLITLSSPGDNSYTDSENTTFNFTATDDVDTRFNCSLYLNSVYNQTNDTTNNGTLTQFTVNLAEGTHNYYISCNDSSDLSRNSDTYSFTIDATTPNIKSESYATTLELGDTFSYSSNITDTHLTYANISYDTSNFTMSNSSTNFTYSIITYINGTNNENIYALDESGNINYTNISYTVSDTISGPRLVNLLYTSSLDQGATQTVTGYLVNSLPISTATFTVDDTNYTMTNNTYYNFTYEFTTDTCAETNFTIWSNDSLGQSYTNTSSFTVTECCGNSVCDASEDCSSCSEDCGACSTTTTSSTSGGGGGGGGGGSSTGESSRAIKSFESATPQDTLTFEIPSTLIPISNLEVYVNKELSNIKITVESLASQPTEITTPEGTTYDYMQITLSNFENEDLDSVDLSFEVTKTWVEENNIDYRTIILQRYNEGWEELETSGSGSSEDYYLYTAESPGFSYFVITGEEKEDIEEDITEEEGEEIAYISDELTGDLIASQAPEEETNYLRLIKIGIIIIFFTLMIIAFFIYEKKHDKI
ncbi:S8 family serine peptidase [archaeon]|nr:S8 family serine peptidase [archaeon]MBT7281763.1 S8 family serine peptidase [archaeon]